MQNVRCRCGKIVCQLENLPEMTRTDGAKSDPEAPAVVILCRHCKSYVVLQVSSVCSIQSRVNVPGPEQLLTKT